jgi:tetrahydromethanopterin S-methyltransferase subunit A
MLESLLKFERLMRHNNTMDSTFKKVHSEIQRGMKLSRCRKCGCMRGTLENLKASLPTLRLKDARELLKSVNEWYEQLEPQAYPCFGCKYCIPPEAMTLLTKKYPALASSTLSSCEIKVSDGWPPVEGEYTVIDRNAPVAVSVLASTKLEEKLAAKRPEGLCIVGKTETENIGIDKIVKNVISNPAIGFLIVTGRDSEGHQSGRTLLALWENGVDSKMRVIGSRGRRPILKNVTRDEVTRFRKQVHMEDMIGSENTRSIIKKIKDLAANAAAGCAPSCGCHTEPAQTVQPVMIPVKSISVSVSSCGCGDTCGDGAGDEKQAVRDVPRVKVRKHSKNIKLDRAGYFVIIPSSKTGNILVEHYSYDNKLLRKIEGKNSRDIYLTIIKNNWVSELSHAAYLGKELARAELSIKNGFKFVQDGA